MGFSSKNILKIRMWKKKYFTDGVSFTPAEFRVTQQDLKLIFTGNKMVKDS